MNLWTYSPEEVIILVMGVPLEGVQEDSFVSLRREAPVFSSTTTTDGRVIRTYNSHDIWEIRFNLLQASPSNGFLNKLMLIDRATRRGKFPIIIKDGMGGTLAFSTTSWIEQLPDIVYGARDEAREWVLKSANMVVNIDGNESQTSFAEDAINTIINAVPGLL